MVWLKSRATELTLVLGLMTRLPLPVPRDLPPTAMRNAVWAYPIAGTLVGLVVAGAFGAAVSLGLSSSLAAAIALVVSTLLSGCLHEDGLADTADGLGGGRTRERKLEIMRDSRIGTYGVMVLIAAFALKWSAITALAIPTFAAPALIVAHATARGVLPVMLLSLGPARADGMGATTGRPPLAASAVAIGLAALLPPLLWPLEAALFAIAAALGAVALVGFIAERQIGGHTGDVLGAGEQAAEVAVLVVAAACLA
jgi:adenosylcobinamide-GDP ribazoletransferase